MTYYEIVRKLIGPIRPVGDSAVDENRLKNMREHITLVCSLVDDLLDVYETPGLESSIKTAVNLAAKELLYIGERMPVKSEI